MIYFISNRLGSAVVEFAIVAPVLLTLLLGGLDLGYGTYVRALLEGEMQKASRDRTLESSSPEDMRRKLETDVLMAVRNIAPEAKIEFSRRVYHDYSNASSVPEEFNDANENGNCDAGEVYIDANNNSNWDIDGGVSDSDGSANDVVVYTATLNYDQLPLGGVLPWRRGTQITARTALRNQPYDKRVTPTERSCK